MYDKIKCSTGWAAVFAAFGYIIWAIIAATDGSAGIEIPTELTIMAMTMVILLALASITMRVGQWAARYVVDALVSDHFELLVTAVTAKLQDHQQQLQQLVKTEVAAALDDVSNRAMRAAIVRQASQAAAETAGADASVTSINGRR